ncbi:MAG: hypothetical protein ACRDBL_04490, partial [Rhabdaerophilum sp.]
MAARLAALRVFVVLIAAILFSVAISNAAGKVLIGLAVVNLAVVIASVWPKGRAQSTAPLRIAGHETSPEFRQALDALPSPTILIDRRAIVMHTNPAGAAAFPGLRAGFPLSAAMRDPELLSTLERVLRGEREAMIELIERVPLE